MVRLEKTWRWFGESDPVTLRDLRQMGIEGVVTALFDLPPGEAWPAARIKALKKTIGDEGLKWRVVESLPVSEGIKKHTGDYDRLAENYRESLRNLGEQGIKTVCYNFMPAIDWIRTDINFRLLSGVEVMNFSLLKFIAFDLFILKRPGAEADYTDEQIAGAEEVRRDLSGQEAEELAYNIIVRTQAFIHRESFKGGEGDYKAAFLSHLKEYEDIGREELRRNLITFLGDIMPVAENYETGLCIHPDDPPFPVLGLPRIVSTFDDLNLIFTAIPSLSNGLTFCSGSLSIRKDNDLKRIAESFAGRIHFAHLRNNAVFENGDFHETGHLEGDANLPQLILVLMKEMERRRSAGRSDYRIPVRPDHGIRMLDDLRRDSPPGYPLIGRFRGLSEISGIEEAIRRLL